MSPHFPPEKPERRPGTGPDENPTTPTPLPEHDPIMPPSGDPMPQPIGDPVSPDKPEAPPIGTQPNNPTDHSHDETPDETHGSQSTLSGEIFTVEEQPDNELGDENQSWQITETRHGLESHDPDLIRKP